MKKSILKNANVLKRIKKIRILIGAIALYLCFCLGRGIYYNRRFDDNNVQMILSAQYSIYRSKIEVYVDDELFYKNDSLQVLYEFTEGKARVGLRRLKVVIDGSVEYEDYFLLFPVRFIYIEIQKYEPFYKLDENWFYVEFSNTPIGLM